MPTGTRISEVTGLQVRHFDLESGCIRIEQRNWRGDIDEPKTAKSRRPLALGILAERYRGWIAGLKRRDPNAWVFPQRDNLSEPMWDSGELTRRIQNKRIKAGKREKAVAIKPSNTACRPLLGKDSSCGESTHPVTP
jgi:integrase